MNVDKVLEVVDIVQGLDGKEISLLMQILLAEDKINVPELVVKHVEKLEKFKEDAMHDIRMLSVAGLDLSEPFIKKIDSIKSEQKRSVALAQAKILMDAGGYKGTVHGENLENSIDTSSLDGDGWFERSWALRVNL